MQEEDLNEDDCCGADFNTTEGLHDSPNINRWFMLLQMSIKNSCTEQETLTLSKCFLQDRVREV